MCGYILVLIALQLLQGTLSWPGMRKKISDQKQYTVSLDHHGHESPFSWDIHHKDAILIGPPCSVGAHNNFSNLFPCPDEPQPTSEHGYTAKNHIFAEQFKMDWKMYFVANNDDPPPYNSSSGPSSPYNYTLGTTWYDFKYNNGKGAALREQYKSKCIPIFSQGSLSKTNNYSCDFINVVNNTNDMYNEYTNNSNFTGAAYVVFHEDRPLGAPECCIVGKPFHPPIRDFSHGLSVKYQTITDDKVVDWSAIWLNDSGIFSFGFLNNSPKEYGIPFAFYFRGIPWIANWCYQLFSNFTIEEPNNNVWTLPDACSSAQACPGWILEE